MVDETANTGRHRTDAQEQEQNLPDEELESYLAALSPEGDPESTGSGRRFGGSQVYQLRLPLMANERLRELPPDVSDGACPGVDPPAPRMGIPATAPPLTRAITQRSDRQGPRSSRPGPFQSHTSD